MAIDAATAGLLGGLVGSVVSLVSNFFAASTQKYVAERNAKNSIQVQKIELINSRYKEDLEYNRDQIKNLHKILSWIGNQYNITSHYIDQKRKQTPEEHDMHYRKICEQLDEAKAIIDMNFKKLASDMKEICDQANIYWGYRRHFLVPYEKKDEQFLMMCEGNVQKASGKIHGRIVNIQRAISEIHQKLKEDQQTHLNHENDEDTPEHESETKIKKLWWLIFLFSSFLVVLIFPNSNYSYRVRELIFVLWDSIFSIFEGVIQWAKDEPFIFFLSIALCYILAQAIGFCRVFLAKIYEYRGDVASAFYYANNSSSFSGSIFSLLLVFLGATFACR